MMSAADVDRSFLWFSSHEVAFKTFFVVGGVIGIAATAVLVNRFSLFPPQSW